MFGLGLLGFKFRAGACTVEEAMAADKKFWEAVGELQQRGWTLADSVTEVLEVRNILSSYLQPRPSLPKSLSFTGMGAGTGGLDSTIEEALRVVAMYTLKESCPRFVIEAKKPMTTFIKVRTEKTFHLVPKNAKILGWTVKFEAKEVHISWFFH